MWPRLDERLARAILSIAAPATPPTLASLAVAQNRKNLAVALYAVLSTDARSLATIQTARDVVLGVLKTST